MVCKCCGIRPAAQLQATAWETYIPPEFCRPCNEHRGDSLKRAEEHEMWLRARLADALRQRQDAREKASEYLAKVNKMHRREWKMLDQLAVIAYEHQPDAVRGCRCGERNCETQKALGSAWLREPLAHYDLSRASPVRRGESAS